MPFFRNAMNYLAHLLLSGNNEKVLIGNYVGDFVKGRLPDPKTLPPVQADFTKGLMLHRYIDSFTDQHPLARQAKRRVAILHPRVAGVVLDIYYDHFLARHFSSYHPQTLEAFTETVYGIIHRNSILVPERMVSFSSSMIEHKWLMKYKQIEGVRATFEGMARRFVFLANCRGAERLLLGDYSYFEANFSEFMPDLHSAAARFLERLDQ